MSVLACRRVCYADVELCWCKGNDMKIKHLKIIHMPVLDYPACRRTHIAEVLMCR